MRNENVRSTDRYLELLSKIGKCPLCHIQPSLQTSNIWEFDYNSLESLGCVAKRYQMICRGCESHTPIVDSLAEAFRLWNESCGVVLEIIRNGG